MAETESEARRLLAELQQKLSGHLRDMLGLMHSYGLGQLSDATFVARDSAGKMKAIVLSTEPESKFPEILAAAQEAMRVSRGDPS